MISLHESVRCVSSTDPFRFRQTLRLALLLLLSADHSAAQQDYGSRLGQRGPRGVEFASFGPSVVSENLNPDLRKWYLPQELLPEYKWQTWETTNYARQRYLSYRSPLTEGEYFYDSFGNYLTRGWLVYDWSEERPRSSEGSRILTTGFLSGLNIFVDRKGHHSISIMIGDNIVITVVRVDGDKVRLGIDAPTEIPIRREELPARVAQQDDVQPPSPSVDCDTAEAPAAPAI